MKLRLAVLMTLIALASSAVIPVASSEDGTMSAPSERPESSATAFAVPFSSHPDIDLLDKFDVVTAYHDRFLPPFAVDDGWTGSVATCTAGTTSQAYEDATLDSVNYFRAMAGLSGVTFEDAFDAKAQEAALMIKALGTFEDEDVDPHNPDPSWDCYSADGAEAAASSNLFIGSSGPAAIYGYVWDFGAGNESVGHRRWILDPTALTMGSGSTDTTNALWVLGATGPRPPDPGFVAWPPPGNVPLTLVFPRWSLAPNSDSADVSGATVTMTHDGVSVALDVLPPDPGAGDDTLVWEVDDLDIAFGQTDSTIAVTVSNVIVDGTPTTYAYQVTVIDPFLTTVVLGGTAAVSDDTATLVDNAASGVGVRIAGADRYDTAARIAANFEPGVAAVFIATAFDFPDALAAGPAAASLDSPILLVGAGIGPSTRAELDRLNPQKIYVLGGTGAVSGIIARDLKEYVSAPEDVVRLSGVDRYGTAAAVSAEIFSPGVPVAYVGTGLDFPDALAGGAAAAREGGPVLLTDPAKLPLATRDELKRLKPARIVLLGGTAAVSDAVLNELKKLTTGTVTRYFGADRYTTAADVSANVFDGPVHRVYVAVGTNFPDALAGVPLAAREGAPILLVATDVAPSSTLSEIGRLDW